MHNSPIEDGVGLFLEHVHWIV